MAAESKTTPSVAAVDPLDLEPEREMGAGARDDRPLGTEEIEPETGRRRLEETAAARLQHGLTLLALSLLVVALIYVMLRELAGILKPLAIAVFMCYLIIPAHRWLVRRRIPSLVSYLCIVAIFSGILYGLGTMLYSALAEMNDRIPDYQEKLDGQIDRVEGLLARLPLPRLPGTAPDRPFRQMIEDSISVERVTGLVTSTLGTFIGFSTTLIIVMFYLIFMLAEATHFEQRLRRAFGPRRAERMFQVFVTINGSIAQFIAVKTFISFLKAAFTMAILSLFAVDFYVLWGILTFFANFVPYVGSIAAVTLPIGLSFIQYQSPWIGLTLAVLLIALQEVTGNLLEPWMFGRRLDLSPVIILVALAFWGSLWGVVGMVLSVPLLVSLRIVLQNMEQTRPLARMMADPWGDRVADPNED